MAKEEKVNRVWINPHVHCSCYCEEGEDEKGCRDNDHDEFYQLFYEIPGVKKENITLKIIKNGVRLEARRDKTTEYFNEYSFLAEAKLDEIDAAYNNGLLILTVPLKEEDPFRTAEPIEIKDVKFK